MFRALEAAPTSINFNEVYSALQTRVVEGQENPIALITSAKFYEVQKYLSKTNHMWDGYWLLASGRVWNRLPQDVRQVIQKHLNEKALAQREDLAKLNTSLEKELAERGMQISNVDGAGFRAKLQSAGFYKEWHQKFGNEAWRLLIRPR